MLESTQPEKLSQKCATFRNYKDLSLVYICGFNAVKSTHLVFVGDNFLLGVDKSGCWTRKLLCYLIMSVISISCIS